MKKINKRLRNKWRNAYVRFQKLIVLRGPEWLTKHLDRYDFLKARNKN